MTNFVTAINVQLVDHMGTDLSVINAATASFAKFTDTWDEVKHPRLLQFLARGMTAQEYDDLADTTLDNIMGSLGSEDIGGRNGAIEDIKVALDNYRHTPTHFSPFTHATATFHMVAPIAIHAQCSKHTVGFSMNTVSRRYVSSEPAVFVPHFRSKPEGNIKQGSGAGLPDDKMVEAVSLFEDTTNRAVETYNYLIDMGVAPEQARFCLPQGVMTEWVWTGSLAAWARFFLQRTHRHAQEETSELANMVSEHMMDLFPYSWYALTGQCKCEG